MPTVETNGVDTYYQRTGNGPPIIFLHGGMSDHQLWGNQVEALADEYEVITYDARGHGHTGGSDHDRYSIGLLADDLKALVEALELEEPRICGLSMGGMTALTYATRYPEDLSALAVSGTVTPQPQSLKEWVVRGAVYPAIVIGTRTVGYGRIESAILWISERLGEDVEEVQTKADALREDSIDPEAEEYPKIYSAATAYRKLPVVMENISVPTLVLYGENEPFIEDHVPVYRRHISDVTVREIPDAGHNSHIQNPDGFTTAIEEFFGERTPVMQSSD